MFLAQPLEREASVCRQDSCNYKCAPCAEKTTVGRSMRSLCCATWLYFLTAVLVDVQIVVVCLQYKDFVRDNSEHKKFDMFSYIHVLQTELERLYLQ